jgi:hypothetical protein
MSAENPYNLIGKGGKGNKGERDGTPSRVVRGTTYTEKEQQDRLQGYISVPQEYWHQIKYSTHVRYIENSGEFRVGGFVLKNPYDVKVEGGTQEKRFIKMQNGFNKTVQTYKEWIVAYEDIAYLYAKCDGVTLTLRKDLESTVKSLNANIKKLVEYCKKLEGRIQTMEETQN